MRGPRHELIRASAGTGKTFQLTNRYLGLIFSGAQPERIVALTFTRKAAAEFFAKIFERLAEGAESPAGAVKLSAQVGVQVTQAQCLVHLRSLLQELHRLQLSTYDSFFGRIVRSFPFELGLPGAPELLSDDDRAVQVIRAQQALSRRTAADPAFFAEFWHACKRATMGVEAKTISEIVGEFIQDNQRLYFEADDAALWGREAAIWGGSCPWEGPTLDPAAEAATLQQAFDWEAMKPTQRSLWEEYVAQLAAWQPPAPMPSRVAWFTVKLLAAYQELESGSCQLMVKSKQVISGVEGRVLKRLARFGFMSALRPRLEATQGIFDVVRLFEDIYSAEVRRAGRITLEDATLLLAGSTVHGPGLSDPALKEALGYRLDASFDHWLLDEFQDTSRVQWRAVGELVDEALQDSDGERSFFAVGDVKQSIYGWRGSDDRLFDRVERRYGAVLGIRELSESHRSAPAVLELVNAVFGATSVLTEMAGEAAAERWRRIWSSHTSAERVRLHPGFSALVHAPESDAECQETILGLLQAIRPLERGLSVAVLTRENDAAENLVDFLRANGGPACSLAANVRPGRDSVAAAGLRSLLTLAAHPGDAQAWVHLRLCPMGRALEAAFSTPAGLSAHLLRLWSSEGLAGMVDYWISLCRPHLPEGDDFSLQRLETCRAAAAALDAKGGTEIDGFVRSLEALEIREHDVPGQVAVMTTHKSKGLDWDLVIVTDLGGNALTERRKGRLAVQRDEDGAVKWICDLPTSELAESDEQLGAWLTAAKEDAAFERLCALYVALTRAKQGLYVVAHPPSGKSTNYRRLLDQALAGTPEEVEIGGRRFHCAWQAGDVAWFDHLKRPAPNAVIELAIPLLDPAQQRLAAKPRGVLPSDAEEGAWRLGFTPRTEAVAFGTEVHAGFARIEWLPCGVEERARAVFAAVDGLTGEAAECVRRGLTDTVAGEIFTAPGPDAEVWREVAFEWAGAGEWVTGRFDRVIVRRAPDGRITSAQLVDFKTSRSTRRISAMAFGAQLGLYRKALAGLCGLPESAVDARILVLQPGRVELCAVEPAVSGVMVKAK